MLLLLYEIALLVATISSVDRDMTKTSRGGDPDKTKTNQKPDN